MCVYIVVQKLSHLQMTNPMGGQGACAKGQPYMYGNWTIDGCKRPIIYGTKDHKMHVQRTNLHVWGHNVHICNKDQCMGTLYVDTMYVQRAIQSYGCT